MPFTDSQIKEKALALEKAGASAQEIEAFVADAVGQRAAPAPAPVPAAPRNAPASPTLGVGFAPVVQSFIESPTAARISGAVGGTLATLRGNTPAGLAAGFGFGVASEAIAQAQEGTSDTGEVVKSGILNAVPSLGPAKGAGSLVTRGLLSMAKYATVGGAAELVGEVAKNAVNTGTFKTYDSLAEAGRSLVAPTAIGGLLGGTALLGGMAPARAERLAFFREAGVNPTLDMLIPEYAALGARVRQFSPAAVRELVESERPVVQAFSDLFPEAVSNEKVRAELAPFLGRLDQQKALAKDAQQAAQKAATLMEEAKVRMAQGFPADEVRKIRLQAEAAQLNALNEKARLFLDAKNTFGSAMSNTSFAESTAQLVSDFQGLRKLRSDELFNAAGIQGETKLFRLGSMISAAEAGLADKRSTDAASKVIEQIGKLADPERGTNTMLTLNQLRELRGKFSEQFATLDPKDRGMPEAIASTAYQSILNATEKTIANISPDALPLYKQAVRYYADTASAQGSRYVQAILRKEPMDTVFGSLAKDISSGNLAELKAFERYLDAVTPEAPEVARMAKNQFSEAIRNSALQSASSGGRVNPKALADLLLNIPEKAFAVENLGFGSRKAIKEISAIYREYGLNSVTKESIEEVLNNPIVQEAVTSGKNIPAALRPLAAKQAYEANLRRQVLRETVGLRRDAGDIARAQALAKQAKLDAGEQERILKSLQADPIMQEFAEGATWGVKPNAASGSSPIIDSIINAGERGEQFIATLRREKPKVAELIEARYLSEKMGKFFQPSSRPEAVWEVNKEEVQRFFNSLNAPRDTPEGMAKAFIAPERMDKLKKTLKVFQEMIDVSKTGDLARGRSASAELARALGMTQGLAAGRGLSGGSMAGVGARNLSDWYALGKWKAFSAMISDRPFANAFWEKQGSVVKALDAIGPGRAYQLLRAHPDLAEAAAAEAEGRQP